MKNFIQAVACILSLILWCSGAWAWQAFPKNGNANDEASAVAVDRRGDIVAAGRIGEFGYSFAVIKFDRATGAELWRQLSPPNNLPGPTDEAFAVGLDARGNVVAAGQTAGNFTVVKLDRKTGGELWRRTLGPGSALAVALDDVGNVIAAGYADNETSLRDFMVVKLSGKTGAELWRQVVIGSRNVVDSAFGVTVDARGDVIAVGSINNVDGNVTLVKYSGIDGTELWRISANTGRSVTVDRAGNVIAGGGAVYKFDGATGTELWRNSGIGLGVSRLTLDADGNVVAAGNGVVQGRLGFAVIKLDGATGAELWSEFSGSSFDEARAVTVDRENDVIAAGHISLSAIFTTIKYDGATGLELWRQELVSRSGGPTGANAVDVDRKGDVAVAGSTLSGGVGFAFSVVKLNGTDGGDFPTVLTVKPAVVRAGHSVTARWRDINAPTSTDWIGLYLPGTANTDFIDWIYVSCSKTPSSPQRNGSCDFVVPASLAPGFYELRLLANDGFMRLASSNAFRVTEQQRHHVLGSR